MAVPDSSRTSLDGHGIFAIIVFAIVALICIQPVYIPVPNAISTRARYLRERLIGGDVNKTIPDVVHDTDGQTTIQQPPATGAGTQGPRKRAYIILNHVWTPAIGILFLLATTTIGGEQIKLGIVGEEGVEPYDVLVFFISLAYIAISLDATGLLRYLAFQVCLKAGNSGRGLYFILYAFFWTLGVLVGNDPVILSGTAFLVYLTRVAGISPPSAWIWGQFVAANISSAVLVSSNPTNLVIASGFHISFPVYTAYMVLPSLVSAAAALVAILLFFRNKDFDQPKGKSKKDKSAEVTSANGTLANRTHSSTYKRSKGPAPSETDQGIAMAELSGQPYTNGEDTVDQEEDREVRRTPLIYIPKTIVRPDVNPREALVDAKGAIFASVIMAATLITVIITNVTGGAKVYMIAAPGAAVALGRDVVYDWYTWRSFRKKEKVQASDVEPDASQTSQQVEQTSTKQAMPVKQPLLAPLIKANKAMQDIFPTVTYVMARLPFPLLPFAFGMFILVQSLQHVGFINIMSGGLGDVCSHGYIGCSFFISLLGVILCNLGGTNIGATILLTRALQSTYFQERLPPQDAELILRAASYSVAFGSNVGALGGTFAASLAGLLWRDGLRQRGVLVTKSQFALWCAVVIVPATVSGVAILIPEVRYFNL